MIKPAKNKQPLLTFALAGVILLIGMGCGEENESLNHSKEAIIFNYGDPSLDGCGWVIKIVDNNEVLKPMNLSNDFMVDNLKVNIQFTKQNEYYRCGLNSVTYKMVSIFKIKKI